jgi:cytochrome c55X
MTRSKWASLAMILLLAMAQASLAGPSGARQLELRHLLVQDCGSCHGMTLKGGLGPALLPDNLAGKPDALLVNTILLGRPGTAMPPWQALLSEEDAVWLVEVLRAGTTHD